MPEEALEELKKERVADLIRYAAKKSLFYKDLYRSFDLNTPFSELYPSLPSIGKSEVRVHLDEIPTMSLRFLKKANTSGTSGRPVSVYRSPASIIREHAYVWHYRRLHGLNIGDPVVFLRASFVGEELYHFNKAENSLSLSSYQMSPANIEKYAAQLEKFQPKGLCAYPSTAFTLASLLEQTGRSVKIPAIFTSSESLYGFQREKIEAVFGGKVFDLYGSVERTLMLGQCEYGNYHEFPMYSMSEFSDTGVVSTSLINRAFPLIKYYMDDQFVQLDGVCACGRRKGIKSIDGRYDDVILLDDGTQVTAMNLSFHAIGHLRYAQIVQEKPGSIQVNLVTEPGFNDNDQQDLLRKLRLRLHDSMEIFFNQVEEKDIIKSKSGKFQLVISKCMPTKRDRVEGQP